MKKTMLAVATAALMLCACHKQATTPVPAQPGQPTTPSNLVIALDAMDIAAATAAPWFPGTAGAWLSEVQPTATEIAADLQQPNPFARAQALDLTLQHVLASEPALSSMTPDQQRAAASITGAIQAFLLLYEAQAGITPATPIGAHALHVRFVPNSADLAILQKISKGE